jgi:hypothetical protein
MDFQHAAPIVIDDLMAPQKAVRLERIRRSAKVGYGPHFVENLLQQLLHDHPSTVPVEEIEPAFRNLRSVCQELRLGPAASEKYLDNLLVNADGRLCLVECKLWHNPQAAREVVGQILDYAAILASMSYDALLGAVRRTLKVVDGDPLIAQVLGADAAEEDREAFIDGVSDSLRRGNFLLLVVGDGIRSGVQEIAKVLQNSTMGFSFGLIEIAIFGNPGGTGPYYVQPRILARTELIARTIFVAPLLSGELPQVVKVGLAGPAQSISEKEFYDQLAIVDASYPTGVRKFLDECEAIGCESQLRKQISFYVDTPLGKLSLGTIRKDGFVEVWGASRHDGQIGAPIGLRYMQAIVTFLGDARIKDDFESVASWHLRQHERVGIKISELLRHPDEWLQAIQTVIEGLKTIEQSDSSTA